VLPQKVMLLFNTAPHPSTLSLYGLITKVSAPFFIVVLQVCTYSVKPILLVSSWRKLFPNLNLKEDHFKRFSSDIQGVEIMETLFCVRYIERTSVGNTEGSSAIRVSALVIVLSDRPCERIRKWETCPILKEGRSLVHV
jgi:hypothetical protein